MRRQRLYLHWERKIRPGQWFLALFLIYLAFLVQCFWVLSGFISKTVMGSIIRWELLLIQALRCPWLLVYYISGLTWRFGKAVSSWTARVQVRFTAVCNLLWMEVLYRSRLQSFLQYQANYLTGSCLIWFSKGFNLDKWLILSSINLFLETHIFP